MQRSACSHLNTELRWKRRDIGMIGRQCLDCLERVGNWPKHEEAIRERGTLDGMLDWDATTVAVVRPIRADSGESPERFVESPQYQLHLQSEYWRRMRKLVIERSNGVCEGCRMQGAEHVHHRTYTHFGHEFAFELLALCEDCHRRVHAK